MAASATVCEAVRVAGLAEGLLLVGHHGSAGRELLLASLACETLWVKEPSLPFGGVPKDRLAASAARWCEQRLCMLLTVRLALDLHQTEEKGRVKCAAD